MLKRVALALAIGAPVAAQTAQLPDVIDRLGSYLLNYEAVLTTLVAEERYDQSLRLLASAGGRVPATQHRVLLSDFAMAKLPGGFAWLGLRDTYSVDGRPLRDRSAHLEQLLADSRDDAWNQAVAISRENARHNLGEDLIQRNVNVPTAALDLLQKEHHPQFAFDKRGEETIDGRRVWRVEYRERGRPTIIRDGRGRDQPARGLVWIVPGTGEVLKTTLMLDDSRADLRSLFVVTYAHDAALELLVPTEMIEQYQQPYVRIESKATYTKYRRFQTSARIIPPR